MLLTAHCHKPPPPPRPGLPLVLNGLNLVVRAGFWKGMEGSLMGAKMIFIYIPLCLDCG